MNENYRSRLFQTTHCTPIVSQRLAHLLDVVEFDKFKIVFDVGSWHLDQTIEFASILPNAVVCAFEPNPQSAQLCREKRSGLSQGLGIRVSIHELALSDKEGTASFFPLDPSKTSSTNHGMSSLLELEDGKTGQWHNDFWVQKQITVKTDTMDSWCERFNLFPDLLWVDVQGAEALLFAGGTKALTNNVKVVLTEVGIKPYYKGHTLKPEIDSLMTSCGFVELTSSFEMAGDYEANTIYYKP